jgi:hypothetical protein
MEDKNLSKVNVRVHPDLHTDLNRLVPWGMRRHLIEAVLKLIVDSIRTDGIVMIGAILAGRFSLVRNDQEVVQNLNKSANEQT